MNCPLRGGVSVAVATIICCGLSLRALSAEPPKLPRSPEAQLIIEQVEEIFHVDPERAETCVSLLDHVLKEYPGTHQAALALAYLSYGNEALGNADAAQQFREQLEREFPDSLALGELLLLAGKKAQAEGEYERARGELDRAVAVLDNHLSTSEGRLMREEAGLVLARLHKEVFRAPQAALAVLKGAERALTGSPGQVRVWTEIASLSQAWPDGPISLEAMAGDQLRADEFSAESRAAAILAAAGWYYREGQYVMCEEALARFSEDYPLSPHRAEGDIVRGRLLSAGGASAEEMVAYWGMLIERHGNDPRIARAYFRRAEIYQNRGEYELAVRELEAARDNASLSRGDRACAGVEAGDLYRKLGRDDLAIAAYQMVRKNVGGVEAAWKAVSLLEDLGIDPWP